MNDILNLMGFDLTKKLHGHVRVETRNRWTGKVIDAQEKDNLVTDAVQKMIQTVQWGNSSAILYNVWTPLYTRALGGIMLFDSTLTEQANNIYFPASAKLVACAGQDSDSSDSMRGSRNADESIFTSNGYTTVWDFLTSQANGTIASIARTSHRIAGNPLFKYSDNGYNFRLGSQAPYVGAIGYDETNHYLYLAVNSAQTVQGISFATSKIYRVKTYLSSVGLITPPVDAQKMEVVKTLTSSDGSAAAYRWVYDKYADNFVYINGSTIHLVATDGTHTTKTATGVSGGNFTVTETYYWVASGTTLYRITKSNTSDIQTYSVAGPLLAPSKGDVVFAWARGLATQSIVYPDGTVKDIAATAGSTSSDYAISSYCELYPFYSTNSANGTYMYPASNYLGTIANLDSPVTKTSSQTMKITYTLTEA